MDREAIKQQIIREVRDFGAISFDRSIVDNFLDDDFEKWLHTNRIGVKYSYTFYKKKD